jgi:hypothetical protein
MRVAVVEDAAAAAAAAAAAVQRGIKNVSIRTTHRNGVSTWRHLHLWEEELEPTCRELIRAPKLKRMEGAAVAPCVLLLLLLKFEPVATEKHPRAVVLGRREDENRDILVWHGRGRL